MENFSIKEKNRRVSIRFQWQAIYSHLMLFQFLELVIQCAQQGSLARQPQVPSKQKMPQPANRQNECYQD